MRVEGQDLWKLLSKLIQNQALLFSRDFHVLLLHYFVRHHHVLIAPLLQDTLSMALIGVIIQRKIVPILHRVFLFFA